MRLAFVLSFALIGVAATMPVPTDVGGPGEVDCLCAIHGAYADTTAGGLGANLPTVMVTFGGNAQSGNCDGPGPICPQIGPCSGKVNLNVQPKANTQFSDDPGVFGVGNYGTFNYSETLSDCGETESKKIIVWSNGGGNPLGTVTLYIYCTLCSDSIGE